MESLLDIGPALTALRRARGMSQRELGVRLGVAQQQIARWEASGYQSTSLERVNDVALELGWGPEGVGTQEPGRTAGGLGAREPGRTAGGPGAREPGWPTGGLGAEAREARDLPLAAEALAVYGGAVGEAATAVTAVPPVRDLGEVAARIRANGRELKERFGIVRIGVFGSFASGEQTAASDVDLLVEMPEPGGFLFIEAAQFVEDALGRSVDFVRPQGLHPRMKDRVLKDAVYVWAA